MNEIKCPYCENVHEEWWEYIDFEDDEQEFDMDCEDCGKSFHLSMYTTRTFNCDKKEGMS